jgi:arylsulfate sulfotransferase
LISSPATFTTILRFFPTATSSLLTNFARNFTDLPGYPGTTAVVGDGIVDLDENWNPVWSWNGFDHLDLNRHLFGLPDWTHGVALVYPAADGNLLLSRRHQSWVLKIDYNNGTGGCNILWKLGYQGDFAMTQGDLPTTDPSLWFSFQHFPSGSAPSYVPCYSRATIFQVEESTMVANLFWDSLPGDAWRLLCLGRQHQPTR